MTKPITLLMEQEMTRKEFLAMLGFGLATLMGFSTILHLFTGKRNPLTTAPASKGYGGAGYGA